MANQPLLHNWPMATKATEFGEITQNNGHYVVQGHSRWLFWYQSKAISD